MPFADHVTLVPGVVHVLRQNLGDRATMANRSRTNTAPLVVRGHDIRLQLRRKEKLEFATNDGCQTRQESLLFFSQHVSVKSIPAQ